MSSVSCSNLGEINYMILGSQVQNYDSLTHLPTRVKSRDASASKNSEILSPLEALNPGRNFNCWESRWDLALPDKIQAGWKLDGIQVKKFHCWFAAASVLSSLVRRLLLQKLRLTWWLVGWSPSQFCHRRGEQTNPH